MMVTHPTPNYPTVRYFGTAYTWYAATDPSPAISPTMHSSAADHDLNPSTMSGKDQKLIFFSARFFLTISEPKIAKSWTNVLA